MGSKKEDKKYKNLKESEVIRILDEAEKKLTIAQSKLQLEQMKIILIKMFQSFKENSDLMEHNERRVELLKNFNLNLQFLNRLNDILIMVNQGKVEAAYDEILSTVQAINSHPKRYEIKDWIKQDIRKTLQDIADEAVRLKKDRKQNQNQKPTSQIEATIKKPLQASPSIQGFDKTILPEHPSNPESFPNPLDQTIKPNNIQTPFAKSNTSSNPNDSVTQKLHSEDNSPKTLKPTKEFEQRFKPHTENIETYRPQSSFSKDSPNPFPSNSPFSENMKTMRPPQSISKEDSIQDFWKQKTKTKKNDNNS